MVHIRSIICMMLLAQCVFYWFVGTVLRFSAGASTAHDFGEWLEKFILHSREKRVLGYDMEFVGVDVC